MNLDDLIDNFIDDIESGNDHAAIAGAREIVKLLNVLGSPTTRSIDSDALSFIIGTLQVLLQKTAG